MRKILIITGILPIQEIEYKKTENDILLETEDRIKKHNLEIEFEYFFIFPYANKLLAEISKKWNTYYQLSQKRKVIVKSKVVFPIPLILLPRKFFFRNLLIDISFFFLKNRINLMIQEIKPTIIHAQESDSSAYLARKISKKFHIPYIVTLRGINKFIDKHIESNLQNASKLVAISPLQLRSISPIFETKTSFIPHGIDDAFFNNKAVKENVTEVKTLKFLIVARLLKLKNIDIVLRALALFKYDFIFDIYGDGPERENIQKIIYEYDLSTKVTLKGYVQNEELTKIYSNYDLFIMVSNPETFGRVYIESMASGIPVIASKGTGIDGLITHGNEGALLDPFSANFNEEFLDVLNKFIEKEGFIQKCSNNARHFAMEFSWEKIIPKYKKLYNDF